MKKRLIAALLWGCLLAAPALAAGSFPAVNTYAPGYYTDVKADDWFAAAAKLCYEAGLITGTRANTFSPDNAVTVGEAAALAARILSSVSGDAIRAEAPGEAWYRRYVDFWEERSVAVPDPAQNASRNQFFHLLAAVVPQAQLPAVNAIETLPDTDDPDILRFYNAGVLTGTDAYGTFQGGRGLRRSECATMVARIIDPDLRETFTLKSETETPTLSPEEELLQTEAFRVNGVSVSFEGFLDTLNACVAETNASLKANNGKGLDWNAKYTGVDDLPGYFKEMARARLVESTLISAQAKALGCSEEALPAVLTPDPAKALDKIYCAKHILVDDEQTAKAIIAALQAQVKADPTKAAATFDSLMAQYGTDPGMKSDPRGYIFTDGDMVAEFENAAKALNLGACSNVPVKSQFGYHVILRLDPKSRSGWEQAVQELRYEDYLDAWMAAATVTPNTAELNKLDVQARYEAYLASQNG